MVKSFSVPNCLFLETLEGQKGGQGVSPCTVKSKLFWEKNDIVDIDKYSIEFARTVPSAGALGEPSESSRRERGGFKGSPLENQSNTIL